MKLRISVAAAVLVVIVAIGVWLASGPGHPPGDSDGAAIVSPPVASPETAVTSIGPPDGSSNVNTGASPRMPAHAPRAIVRPAGAEPYGLPVSTAAASKMNAPRDQAAPRANVNAAVPSSGQAAPEAAGAEIDVDKVSLMLRDYRTRMGENPVGTNAEIMKAIMEGNPAKAMLGPPEGQKLNDDGELVDRWETPYFFHQLSADHMEIRSAGPDKKMWTKDDVVIR